MKTLKDRLVMARTLKSERDGVEFTQQDLAKKAGVSQGAIAHLESGRTLTSRNLTAIAEALGVQPRWLAEGKGLMFTDGSREQNLAIDSLMKSGKIYEMLPKLPPTPPPAPPPQHSLMWVDPQDLELLTLFHGTDQDGRAKILRTAARVPKVVPAKAIGNQT